MKKTQKCLKSPIWKIVNSALFVFILTTCISTCRKTDQLKLSIESSNTQISDLKVAINNSISQTSQLAIANKNQVNIVNQSITKVEKEIANIKEVIHQLYGSFKKEVMSPQDENVKIKLIPIPTQAGDSALFFKLERTPKPNSIKIVNRNGTVVPFTTLKTSRNVLMVQISGLTKLFPNKDHYYEISYMPDFIDSRPLYTLEDIEMIKMSDKRYEFQLKENK